MLVAVFISRRLTTKKAILQNAIKPKDLRNATLGCAVTGITIAICLAVIPHSGGSILSALQQVNQFIPMAIILGTVHQIRKTGGASSTSPIAVLAALLMFGYYGLIAFSKGGLFMPVLCWLFAAASMRYRLKKYEVVGLGLVFYVLIHFFVPYSQYGRDAEGVGVDFEGNVRVAWGLLHDLGGVRDQYADVQAAAGSGAYYNQAEGFLDRIQILKPDDGLINATEERGPIGLSPVWMSFVNLIPHVFYPNKPQSLQGNIYAHEVGGLLADEDETTGISFSPSAEGYHMAKWAGIFVVAPILWTMLFTLYDSLCGDVRKSPWGLLIIAVFSHAAPEGMLGAVVYMMGYSLIGLLFAVFASAYVMPIIGTLIAGPEQVNQKRTVRLLSAIRLRQSLQSAQSAGETVT
jgi:hypothetical protein